MPNFLLFQSPSSERLKLTRQLENDVHTVVLAETLGQAMTALQNQPFKALLIDGFMNSPRGSRGPDMLLLLPTGSLPVIASSHDTQPWISCLGSPHVHFLPKDDDGWDYTGLRRLLQKLS